MPKFFLAQGEDVHLNDLPCSGFFHQNHTKGKICFHTTRWLVPCCRYGWQKIWWGHSEVKSLCSRIISEWRRIQNVEHLRGVLCARDVYVLYVQWWIWSAHTHPDDKLWEDTQSAHWTFCEGYCGYRGQCKKHLDFVSQLRHCGKSHKGYKDTKRSGQQLSIASWSMFGSFYFQSRHISFKHFHNVEIINDF